MPWEDAEPPTLAEILARRWPGLDRDRHGDRDQELGLVARAWVRQEWVLEGHMAALATRAIAEAHCHRCGLRTGELVAIVAACARGDERERERLVQVALARVAWHKAALAAELEIDRLAAVTGLARETLTERIGLEQILARLGGRT